MKLKSVFAVAASGLKKVSEKLNEKGVDYKGFISTAKDKVGEMIKSDNEAETGTSYGYIPKDKFIANGGRAVNKPSPLSNEGARDYMTDEQFAQFDSLEGLDKVSYAQSLPTYGMTAEEFETYNNMPETTRTEMGLKSEYAREISEPMIDMYNMGHERSCPYMTESQYATYSLLNVDYKVGDFEGRAEARNNALDYAQSLPTYGMTAEEFETYQHIGSATAAEAYAAAKKNAYIERTSISRQGTSQQGTIVKTTAGDESHKIDRGATVDADLGMDSQFMTTKNVGKSLGE